MAEKGLRRDETRTRQDMLPPVSLGPYHNFASTTTTKKQLHQNMKKKKKKKHKHNETNDNKGKLKKNPQKDFK